MQLRAPFPYFGGKRNVASLVWDALGDVKTYIEPFLGSGAVLIARPECHKNRRAYINDANACVSNFWRAVKHDPDGVAQAADWPVFHADLVARRWACAKWRKEFTVRMMDDPDYYNSKIAGWWAWAQRLSIGKDNTATRKTNSIPGSRRGNYLDNNNLKNLCDAIKHSYVISGDWKRCVGTGYMLKNTVTGIFLDPPYDGGDAEVYGKASASENANTFRDVVEFCKKYGNDEWLRIVLCGYAGGAGDCLESIGWSCRSWKANGGYGNRTKSNANRFKERIWLSPGCLAV